MNCNEIDAQLSPLLDALSEAVVSQSLVIALSLWRSLPAVALLPCHLHIRWPDKIDGLSLLTSATVLPVSGADRRIMEEPLYPVVDAYSTRVVARWYRREAGISHAEDFTLADWEEGYRRHRPLFAERVLGANSYLAVDTVMSDGRVMRGSRPVLGHVASRDAPRPYLYVPGRGLCSPLACATLTSGTLTIINLQQVRGGRTIDLIRRVLLHRQATPTLIVASSPSDLFALNLPQVESAVPIYTIGPPPTLEHPILSIVGRDRLQDEQRLIFAITELRGSSPALDALLDLAERAWWVARQSLDTCASRSPIFLRFLQGLEDLKRVAPTDVDLLSSARVLVEETLRDEARVQERILSLISHTEQHFLAHPGWRTRIVVQQQEEINILLEAMSLHWNASMSELREFGIEVQLVRNLSGPCDTIILNGYGGLHSLDALLKSQARSAVLVLDPVEARVAFYHVMRMRRVLERTQAHSTLHILECLTTLLAEGMARSPEVTVRVALTLEKEQQGEVASSVLVASKDEQTPSTFVSFRDGTSVVCSATYSFDVLDAEGVGLLHQVAAQDLVSGDEVVIVVSDMRTRFSERLIHLLDAGPLSEECSLRLQWLTVVAITAQYQQRTAKNIREGLRRRGISVSVATVRSWVRTVRRVEDGTVPELWAHVQGLAAELGLAFSDSELRRYHTAMRRWRALHRRAGRVLVRLLRHAAVGRLDAATLYDVEAKWGLSTRDLVQGAQILIVDDVVDW